MVSQSLIDVKNCCKKTLMRHSNVLNLKSFKICLKKQDRCHCTASLHWGFIRFSSATLPSKVVNVLHTALLLTHSQSHFAIPLCWQNCLHYYKKKLHEETDLHDLLRKKVIFQLDENMAYMVCMAPDIQTTVPLQLKR